MRFRAAPRSAYIIRPVDDLTLVYHRGPDTTHVVSPVIVAILDTLYDKVMSITEIADALTHAHEIDDSEGSSLIETVTVRLDEMAKLDLIDRVS